MALSYGVWRQHPRCPAQGRAWALFDGIVGERAFADIDPGLPHDRLRQLAGGRPSRPEAAILAKLKNEPAAKAKEDQSRTINVSAPAQ
jgi:hypothetical protein